MVKLALKMKILPVDVIVKEVIVMLVIDVGFIKWILWETIVVVKIWFMVFWPTWVLVCRMCDMWYLWNWPERKPWPERIINLVYLLSKFVTAMGNLHGAVFLFNFSVGILQLFTDVCTGCKCKCVCFLKRIKLLHTSLTSLKLVRTTTLNAMQITFFLHCHTSPFTFDKISFSAKKLCLVVRLIRAGQTLSSEEET